MKTSMNHARTCGTEGRTQETLEFHELPRREPKRPGLVKRAQSADIVDNIEYIRPGPPNTQGREHLTAANEQPSHLSVFGSLSNCIDTQSEHERQARRVGMALYREHLVRAQSSTSIPLTRNCINIIAIVKNHTINLIEKLEAYQARVGFQAPKTMQALNRKMTSMLGKPVRTQSELRFLIQELKKGTDRAQGIIDKTCRRFLFGKKDREKVLNQIAWSNQAGLFERWLTEQENFHDAVIEQREEALIHREKVARSQESLLRNRRLNPNENEKSYLIGSNSLLSLTQCNSYFPKSILAAIESSTLSGFELDTVHILNKVDGRKLCVDDENVTLPGLEVKSLNAALLKFGSAGFEISEPETLESIFQENRVSLAKIEVRLSPRTGAFPVFELRDCNNGHQGFKPIEGEERKNLVATYLWLSFLEATWKEPINRRFTRHTLNPVFGNYANFKNCLNEVKEAVLANYRRYPPTPQIDWEYFKESE